MQVMVLNIGANSPDSILTETARPNGASQSWLEGLSPWIKDQPNAPSTALERPKQNGPGIAPGAVGLAGGRR